MCNQSQLLAPFGRARKSTSNILTLPDVRIFKKTVASHQLKYRRHSIVCIFQDISFNIISLTCISTDRKLGCIYIKFYKIEGGCHGRQVTKGNELKRVKGQNVLTSSFMHDPFFTFIYFFF